ncbi:MAG: hypothetical protein K1X67_06405 [Fimbriimonadaceae bacterium]|nr:hypothetical protein [Fimbriimonadaceae bacterium]
MSLLALRNKLLGRCGVVIATVVLWAPIAGSAAPPKLAPNDVTWLWPAPNSTSELDKVISIDSLKSGDGTPVWSDQQFNDVLTAADSDAARVGSSRIKLPQAVRTKAVWRIAAFRVDPTAPGAHEIVRQTFGEKPQLRLIVQPVTVNGNRIEVHDIAVHLVYSFVTQGADGTEAPDREAFREIIKDLDAMKAHVQDAGVLTSGVPLGIHPGLKAEVASLGDKVEAFLSEHLHPEKLNAMALMGLDTPEPWIFLALSKFPQGAEHFGPVPFLPAQMLSFRVSGGGVIPSPTVNNMNPVPNRIPMPKEEKDRRGVATAALFGEEVPELDALAVVGRDENGADVLDDKLKNGDIPDLIADPTRAHFFNTDCLSCHTETRRRIRLGLAPGAFAFRQDGQPPSINPEVMPQDDWNVRNLGWFTPSPFIGGGPAVPTITQRTANETAEVVEFIARQYRHDPAPAPSP